jgi:hypothetical protein
MILLSMSFLLFSSFYPPLSFMSPSVYHTYCMSFYHLKIYLTTYRFICVILSAFISDNAKMKWYFIRLSSHLYTMYIKFTIIPLSTYFVLYFHSICLNSNGLLCLSVCTHLHLQSDNTLIILLSYNFGHDHVVRAYILLCTSNSLWYYIVFQAEHQRICILFLLNLVPFNSIIIFVLYIFADSCDHNNSPCTLITAFNSMMSGHPRACRSSGRFDAISSLDGQS